MPVAVIDTTILELQELDYLREKTLLDAQQIDNLLSQVEAFESSDRICDEIISQESKKTDLWKEEAKAQSRQKEWWKIGAIGLTLILIGSLFLP